MISLAETMEPHGRDGPVEEFMEDLIRGENERIDITQVFLNESGEGMSLSVEENPLRKKSRQDYTPPITEKTPTALVTTTEKPTVPVTKNPTVTEKPRYGACICILVLFRLCYLYAHVNAMSSFSRLDRRNLPEAGSREGQLIS